MGKPSVFSESFLSNVTSITLNRFCMARKGIPKRSFDPGIVNSHVQPRWHLPMHEHLGDGISAHRGCFQLFPHHVGGAWGIPVCFGICCWEIRLLLQETRCFMPVDPGALFLDLPCLQWHNHTSKALSGPAPKLNEHIWYQHEPFSLPLSACILQASSTSSGGWAGA